LYKNFYKKLYLGISSYSFPWAVGVDGFRPIQPLQATDLVQQAIAYGVECLQIGDNMPLHLLTESEHKALQTNAQQAGIRLEVGTRRLTKDHLKYYLDIAQNLHSPFLRVVIDDTDYHPSETEVIAVIREVIDDFKQENIILAIENHDRFPAQSLQRIIESTDPEWVGICLDTANSLGAGEGIREVVTTLAQYTVNVHIKDFTIRRVSHKMGFVVQGCSAGKGMLDIPWLLDQLRPYNRCQSATLELWSDPEPTIEATLIKEKQWADESIRYLHSLFV
jgi:sugar phosphate isomerase/epimerase